MNFRPPIPAAVRHYVMQRAENCCEECGMARPLELHHTTYGLSVMTGNVDDIGESVFGRETPDILLALCRDCHRGKHLDGRGGFYADPQEAEAERNAFFDDD